MTYNGEMKLKKKVSNLKTRALKKHTVQFVRNLNRPNGN